MCHITHKHWKSVKSAPSRNTVGGSRGATTPVGLKWRKGSRSYQEDHGPQMLSGQWSKRVCSCSDKVAGDSLVPGSVRVGSRRKVPGRPLTSHRLCALVLVSPSQSIGGLRMRECSGGGTRRSDQASCVSYMCVCGIELRNNPRTSLRGTKNVFPSCKNVHKNLYNFSK